MLAQNFKAPTDLGISDAEFDALVKVLGMLERGEIEQSRFCMGSLSLPTCRTPACIRGWARFEAKNVFIETDNHPPELKKLFFLDSHATLKLIMAFPGRFNEPISTGSAAIAVRNYLTHGEPRWDEALAS
jgi:hypothetical protein